MSDYYPKGTPLPKYIYKRTLDTIRGYDAMVEEMKDLAYSDAPADGMPRGTDTGDPTYSAASRRARLSREVEAINAAVETVRPEYREVAFKSLKDAMPLYKIPGAEYAHPDTWTRYRQQIIYYTAVYLGWYEE